MHFVKKALFKSSGDIYWPPLSSSLLGELSMDKRDNDHFISRRLVCISSDSSYNSSDSSLVTVGYQLRCLASPSLSALDLLIWHARGTILRNGMQSVLTYSCGHSTNNNSHCVTEGLEFELVVFNGRVFWSRICAWMQLQDLLQTLNLPENLCNSCCGLVCKRYLQHVD